MGLRWFIGEIANVVVLRFHPQRTSLLVWLFLSKVRSWAINYM